MQEYNYKGYVVKILYDEGGDNPREWCNLGTIATWHRNYNLGDTQPKMGASEWLKEQGKGLYLPVYMYEHGGIALSTASFSCRWDSGQLGYIFVSNEKIRKKFSVKRITKKLAEKVYEILEAEIDFYNKWLKGEVYRFNITDSLGESIDDCGGYYDIDDVIAEANSVIDCEEKKNFPLFVAGGLI